MNEHMRDRNIPESVHINEYTRARIFKDPFASTNKHAPGIFRDPDEKGQGKKPKVFICAEIKKGNDTLFSCRVFDFTGG